MFKNNHFAAFAVLVSLVGAPLPALAQCAYGDVTSAHCVPFTPPTAYPGYERPSQSQIDAANARRQAKIDRQIEQYRNTPYYGAIAVGNSRYGYANGYKNLDKAKSNSLKKCTDDDCTISYTFSNTCAAIAQPKADNGTNNNQVFATDSNAETALNKAYFKCEAQYGKGQCGMLLNDKASCSGYEYGIYNQ